MYDHALENNLGYVKYRFSFISKIPDYKGRRVVIPGVGCFEFEDNLIKSNDFLITFVISHYLLEQTLRNI